MQSNNNNKSVNDITGILMCSVYDAIKKKKSWGICTFLTNECQKLVEWKQIIFD